MKIREILYLMEEIEKSHISEIIEVPSRTDDPSHYQLFFKNLKNTTPTPSFSNGIRYGYVKHITDFNEEHYGLFDGKKLVAYLGLESDRIGKPQLTHISVDSELRGLGLQRYLINRALESHNEIYSDTQQTPESVYFWKMLMLYPEPKYKIYIYDTETNTRKPIVKRPSKNYTHDESYGEIWNNQENPILVIVKDGIRETYESTVEFNRVDNIRKRFGKDYWSTWYGDYARDRGYENP